MTMMLEVHWMTTAGWRAMPTTSPTLDCLRNGDDDDGDCSRDYYDDCYCCCDYCYCDCDSTSDATEMMRPLFPLYYYYYYSTSTSTTRMTTFFRLVWLDLSLFVVF